MRYHVTYAAEDYATNKDGDADRFPHAPDAFKVYVMNSGLDHEHGGGRNYQRIIFVEPMTNVPVTKSWAGDSGHEDMRPDAITVTLRGPAGYEESMQLTAAGGWRGEFAITPAGGSYTLTRGMFPDTRRACPVLPTSASL